VHGQHVQRRILVFAFGALPERVGDGQQFVRARTAQRFEERFRRSAPCRRGNAEEGELAAHIGAHRRCAFRISQRQQHGIERSDLHHGSNV
jgi:hypothetical protein